MHPVDKGHLTELNFLLRAVNLGWEVYRAYSPNSRCDAIILKGSNIIRVQIKHGRLLKDRVNFSIDSYNPFMKSRKAYSKDEIDAFGIWCSELNECFLVPIEDCSKGSEISLFLRDDYRIKRHAKYYVF